MFEQPISAELVEYVKQTFAPEDRDFRALTESARAAAMPADWEITSDVGRLFQMICAMIDSRRVLEFGTFAGHSALWFARGMPPDGKVITIEINPEYAAFARGQLDRLEGGGKVEIRRMAALDALATIESEIRSGGERFDIVFLDTEKAFYPVFLKSAPNLLRPGGILLADNVLRSPSWKGQTLLDQASTDERILAIREFNTQLAAHPQFVSTIIPMRAGVAVAVYSPT